MWQQLAMAFCLMLVIEGLLPFINPGRWRHLLQLIDQVDDSTIRLIGLASMLTGTALLYIIN